MKSTLKKIFCLLLVISTAAAFSACGKDNSNKKDQSGTDTVVSQTSAADSSDESSAQTSGFSESSTEEKISMPESWQDNGIFSDYYEKAFNKLSQMSTEEKVGQIILARIPAEDAFQTANDYHLGGYVLFWSDLDEKTKDKIILDNDSYSRATGIPMIIATDEEGGYVSRLSGHDLLKHEDFKSPRELYNNGGMDAIKEAALRKAQLMNNLKINTNLAPVCDICTGEDKFMYDRSLGQDADITSTFVKEVTSISQQNGVSVTLKHFPGYGNNDDTHTGIAIDKRSYETFQDSDFKPFKAGIDEGAHVVLVSHNIVECMDDERPASLSPKVHEILRNELKFTGIIITDDLSMGAIEEYSPDVSPVVNALLAGNDMLCISDIDVTYTKILDGVMSGKIEKDILDHAVMRVLAWKYAKGMIKD